MKYRVIKLLILTCVFSLRYAVVLDEEALINEINDGRKDFAKEEGIANMNKLSWDNGMAVEAAKSCEENFTTAITGVVFPYHVEDQEEYEKEHVKWINAKVRSKTPIYYAYVFEMGNPLQTKVGCATVEDCTTHFDTSDRKFYVKTACFIGPHKRFANHSKVLGEPGTACGNYLVEDTLCVPTATKDVDDATLLLFFGYLLLFQLLSP